MPQVLVRDVDPQTLEQLKDRARRHGRSLQAEVKLILEQAARVNLADFRDTAARLREQFADHQRTDSTDLVREDRER